MTWSWLFISLYGFTPGGGPENLDKNQSPSSDSSSGNTLVDSSNPEGCKVVRSIGTKYLWEGHPFPSKPLSKSVVESTIEDYYHHFFSLPLDSFRNLDASEAHRNSTYKLEVLNAQSGYMFFMTQHTPDNWDGDSKAEWAYEIKYWAQSPVQRLIAVNKTQITWVSTQSHIDFYVHDQDGLRPFSPLKKAWRMTDFTDKDYAKFFPSELNEKPPVHIRLLENDKWVEVHLAIHEYFEPLSVYETYDCLKVTTKPMYFLPEEGVLRDRKP